MSWIAKSFAQLSTEELFAIYQLRTSVFVVEQQCAYQEVDHWDKVRCIFGKNLTAKFVLTAALSRKMTACILAEC